MYFIIILLLSLTPTWANNTCAPTSGTVTKQVYDLLGSCGSSCPTQRAREIVSYLISQGFDCSQPPPDSTQGFRCRGKLNKSYPLPVNIFIPFKFNSRFQTNLALHLHGWNFDKSAEQHFESPHGDFGKYLSKADPNRLLIVPESGDQCVTYLKHLSTTKGFDGFFDEVTELLSSCGVGRKGQLDSLLISSHSGAYLPLALLAKNENSGGRSQYTSKIQSIALYDSVYGQLDSLKLWASRMNQNNGRFTVYFLTETNEGHTGTTAKQTKEFARLLKVPILGEPNANENLPPGIQIFGFKGDHFEILAEDRLTQHWRSK